MDINNIYRVDVCEPRLTEATVFGTRVLIRGPNDKWEGRDVTIIYINSRGPCMYDLTVLVSSKQFEETF